MQNTLVWFLGKISWRKDRLLTPVFLGFPCGSAGKGTACNVGDLGSMPGLGRTPGEGKGFPLQYSGLENSMDCIVHGVAKSPKWLSEFHFHFGDFPVAQMVRNRPAMQETRVWSLGQEDPLETGMAIHSSILAWRIPWTQKPGGLQFLGLQRVGQDWVTNTHRLWPTVLHAKNARIV